MEKIKFQRKVWLPKSSHIKWDSQRDGMSTPNSKHMKIIEKLFKKYTFNYTLPRSCNN